MKNKLKFLNKLITALFFVLLFDQLLNSFSLIPIELKLNFSFIQFILLTLLAFLTNIILFTIKNKISILDALSKINNLLIKDFQQKINFLLTNKVTKYFILPAVFLGLGASLSFYSLLNAPGDGVLILTQKDQIENINNEPLEASQSGQARFKANYDNLGIIAVRFNTFDRSNDDQLIFELQEEGREEAVYENIYNTDQFQNQDPFPFGFPRIADSKNKQYKFKITSIRGASQSAVAVSNQYPNLITKYQYDKQTLLSNKLELINFFKNKLLLALKDWTFLITTIIYYLPFIGYLAILLFKPNIEIYLETIEDYFSLSLIAYLMIEIIIQSLRLGREYLNWRVEPNGHLRITSNILLVITIILGIFTALFGQQEQEE
jgi:hypothetical protein